MNLSADDLLDRYHAAMIAADSDAFAELYAPDGVHEIPFFTPQGVSRLQGPEQIRDYYRPLWAEMPITLDRVENTAVHRTGSAATIISESVSIGHRRDGAPFRLPGLVILTARDSKIIKVRDYMDLLGLRHQLETADAP